MITQAKVMDGDGEDYILIDVNYKSGYASLQVKDGHGDERDKVLLSQWELQNLIRTLTSVRDDMLRHQVIK